MAVTGTIYQSSVSEVMGEESRLQSADRRGGSVYSVWRLPIKGVDYGRNVRARMAGKYLRMKEQDKFIPGIYLYKASENVKRTITHKLPQPLCHPLPH